MPPKSTETRLEHFDEQLYTADPTTLLYKFVDALCGDAGAGSLKKEIFLQRLSGAMDGIYGSDLDYIFGNTRVLSRVSSEAYTYNTMSQMLTSDQWDEVMAKDALYRNRIREFFIAAAKGGTAEGIRQVVHAAISCDCQVLENWRYIDCADEETEILTRSGYKRYSELKEGEEVLTLNISSGLAEWQTTTKINVFPVIDHEMLSVEMGGRHSSLTTMNHRWPVSSRIKNTEGIRGYSGIRIRTSTEITTEDRFIRAAPAIKLTDFAKFSDSLVELVAWFVTEGHVHAQSSVVTIVQSHAVNPTKVDNIRAALTTLIGTSVKNFDRTGARKDQSPAWREWVSCSKPDITVFRLNSAAGRLLIAQAPEKITSMDFINSLTRSQLQLFLDTCIAADGHVRGDGYRSFIQKSMERTVPIQIAATLLGIPTSIQKTQGVCHVLSLCERQKFVQPLGQGRKNAKIVRYTGTVWCPTTPNGTWFARRRGTTYFTGNSFGLAGDVGRAGEGGSFSAVDLATGHEVIRKTRNQAESYADTSGLDDGPHNIRANQARSEITIVPYKTDLHPRETRVLRDMLDRITPQDTVVTISPEGLSVSSPVAVRAITSDSTYYQVEKMVTGTPVLDELPPPEMLAIDLDPTANWLNPRTPELAPYAQFNITQEFGYYYLVSGGRRSPIDEVTYGVLEDNDKVRLEAAFEWYEQNEQFGPWTEYEKADSPDNYPGGKFGLTPNSLPARNPDRSPYQFQYESQSAYITQKKQEVLALGGNANDTRYQLPIQKSTTAKRVYTPDLAIAFTAPVRDSTVTSSWTSRKPRYVSSELRNSSSFIRS